MNAVLTAAAWSLALLVRAVHAKDCVITDYGATNGTDPSLAKPNGAAIISGKFLCDCTVLGMP